MIDNAIISGDVNNKCRIVYFESKRKRYVYAKSLNCYHRQRIQIVSQGKNWHILLIDPFESRAEVTLLHMPIETNPAVIEHIFKSLNPEWKASAIKQVPGEQMRADRWELLVACSDKRLIPQGNDMLRLRKWEKNWLRSFFFFRNVSQNVILGFNQIRLFFVLGVINSVSCGIFRLNHNNIKFFFADYKPHEQKEVERVRERGGNKHERK